MNRFTLHLLTGACSLFAGILLSGGVKDWGKTLAMGGLMAVPSIYITHLIVDTQANNRLKPLQKKLTDTSSALERSHSQLSNVQARLTSVDSQNVKLLAELEFLRSSLGVCHKSRTEQDDLLAQLKSRLTQLAQELSESKGRVSELEEEVQQWEQNFHDYVATEADKQFKVARANEIQQIFDEHDAITGEAMQLFRELQAWGQKIAHGHATKREIITNLATQYNQNLDELGDSVEKERAHYLEQIELLHEKVGRLQHQLAGDLLEPEYGQFGFDPSGRIANALAEWLWTHRQIPLRVTGFEVGTDGVVTAGYVYPRSMSVEALVRVLENDSAVMARNLGLYAIEKPQKLQIADVLTVKVRRERPSRKADKGSLYRSSEELIKYILSQPVRLRIVGEPGAGKTPTVAVLLSHILKRGFLEANTPNGRKLPYCVVESCNPLAGISVKNGDELDFCLKWNSGAKGFKGLAEEYRFRKNPANADYKNLVGYIWTADEIDNSMADLTKDEAKPFKDALKDGGHVNLGVIVMGQSANISTSKGLSIDDQKMMTNLYIDPVSIRTFLTQYGERFYSKRAVEKALATLEELELEIEEKNEVICDTAREFRIAMVTASRSPVYYQLPYFDSVEIDLEAYQQTLVQVSIIRDRRGKAGVVASVLADSKDVDTAILSERPDVSRRSPYVGLETGRDTSVKPVCPHCGSDKIRSKGDSWLCQNPEHSTFAPNKPKSWKK
jgi:predicted  nucleic acid-binding Zn-ribbon protein